MNEEKGQGFMRIRFGRIPRINTFNSTSQGSLLLAAKLKVSGKQKMNK